jgi:chemotaxis protein methyltransferase CheR
MPAVDEREQDDELEELELELLLEAVSRRYGIDLRGYDPHHLRRRVQSARVAEQLGSISALQDRVLHELATVERLVAQVWVPTTSMFRDPSFWQTLAEKVFPMLEVHPFIRVWHAGCSTGEEVYSAAVLLHEAGLLERCRLYATDVNEALLKTAGDGIFPRSVLAEHEAAYKRAGGKASLTDYFSSSHEHVIFRQSLRRNLIFAHHNLVTDHSFNEFHLILCRNVTSFFAGSLKDRVHRLFYESLRRFGVLGLGREESLRGVTFERHYDWRDAEERLYRRGA